MYLKTKIIGNLKADNLNVPFRTQSTRGFVWLFHKPLPQGYACCSAGLLNMDQHQSGYTQNETPRKVIVRKTAFRCFLDSYEFVLVVCRQKRGDPEAWMWEFIRTVCRFKTSQKERNLCQSCAFEFEMFWFLFGKGVVPEPFLPASNARWKAWMQSAGKLSWEKNSFALATD